MTAHDTVRLVAEFIDDIAEIGRHPLGGWHRPGFSRLEREAHEVFARWGRELGLTVRTDPSGNTFATRPGRLDRPPILLGSHLDTVGQGGAYDGVVGVAAGLAVAHLLADDELDAPVAAVAFATEEGARFGAPCVGSQLMTGEIDQHVLAAMVDVDGVSALDAAHAVGLDPGAEGTVWSPGSVGAFIEVHIEQGRVLEDRSLRCGIVDTVAGSTRLRIRFTGRADHSGATPMRMRQDALAAAAEVVGEVERQAARLRTAVATVGQLDVSPNSLTTVPGAVTFTIDVRDVDSDRQRALTQDLIDTAHRTGARRDVAMEATLLSDHSPVVLHQTVQQLLAEAAAALRAETCVLPSGAGHDAQHLSRLGPTGMLFIPCRDGLSHNPAEHCDLDDIVLASRIAAEGVRRIDAQPVPAAHYRLELNTA